MELVWTVMRLSVWTLPGLIVVLVGLAFAIRRRKRHPGVSRVLIIAFSCFLLADAAGMIGQGMFQLAIQEQNPVLSSGIPFYTNLVTGVLGTVGLALLVYAALMHRNTAAE